MKSLSEIYTLLLAGFRTFYQEKGGEGICIYASYLDSIDAITAEERYELVKDMSISKPSNTKFVWGYWWDLDVEGLEKRLQFLRSQRSKALKKELEADGWIQCDASTNQYRKDVGCDDTVFLFREDRIINPETEEFEVYEAEINTEDYDWSQIVDACETFGYTAEQIDDWLNSGEERALIAECLFELQN